MLTCKEYTELKKKELKEYIEEKGLHPTLVVIQVGDRPESNSYIRGKMRDCEEVGIECIVKKYNENISEHRLLDVICSFNEEDDVHGIIVQLPLPDHIDAKELQKCISPLKDVDGFRDATMFEPCTPLGVINYLKFVNYEFEGKDALVIGRSDIVGKPLARMLTDLDCTVTLARSKTRGVEFKAREADIVFTCVDKIEYFDNNITYTKYPYQDIIDIGLGVSERDGKLHGNLKESTVKYIRELYPERICISGTGGVGLLTRLALLENVVRAAELAMGA